jgi:hypothetical protein
MLTTKIRTSIISLIAAGSFATAAVLPAVSQASKNTGAYEKSLEAEKSVHEAICGDFWRHFEAAVNNADTLYKQEGNSAAFKQELANAKANLGSGVANGCDWASHVQPPSEPSEVAVVVTPVSVAQGSPEGLAPVPSVPVTPSRPSLR